MDMARVFYAQQQEQLDVLRQELSALEQVTSKLDTLREVIETRFGPSFPSPMLADKGAAATDLSAKLGQNPIEDRNRSSASAPVTTPNTTPVYAQATSERSSVPQQPTQAARDSTTNSNMHAQLLERLANLHRLRQGRLRRILQLITGG
jgi:hypothetical protein